MSDSVEKKNDNRMLRPSGSHLKKKCKPNELYPVLILFWQPNGMLIRFTFFSKCEPDEGAIWLSFPKQNENRIKLIQLSCCKIGKTLCSLSTVPKHQINYSNQQYYLLIANKHQKLVTYNLFEGLIEDLEERNKIDKI